MQDNATAQQEHEPQKLWKTPRYPAWLVTDTGLSLTSSIHGFSLPLIVAITTGSTAVAGVLRGLESVLWGILLLPGGMLIDNVNRRYLTLIRCLSGLALYVAAAAAIALGYFNIPVAVVFVILFAIRNACTSKVTDILLRSIVTPTQLPTAMAVNQGRDASIRLAASPFAGALMTLGTAFPFVFNAILSGINALTTLRLPNIPMTLREERKAQADDASQSNSGFSFSAMFEGLRIMRRSPLLLATSTVGSLQFAFFSAALLISIWQITEVSHSTALAGLVSTANAIGMLVGATLVAPLIKRFRGGHIIGVSMILMCLSVLMLLLLADTPWLFLAFIPAMLANPASEAVLESVIVLAVPNELLGRSMSAGGLIELPIDALVMAGAGIGFQYFGFRVTVGILLAGLIVVSIAMYATRAIRDIPFPHEYEAFAQATIKADH